ANSQLSEDQANKLKIKHRIPVKVVEQELPSHSIAPGLSTTGIVSLEMASSSEPIVLSFQFSGRNNAADQPTRPVTAYLVRWRKTSTTGPGTGTLLQPSNRLPMIPFDGR